MKKPESSKLDASVWKELLGVEYEECVHILNDAGEQRLDAGNADTSPGIDSCAVCASQEATVICDKCNQVKYCGEEHQAGDADKHAKVCGVLSKHARLSDIELGDDEVKLAVGQLLDACCKAKKPVGSWEALFDALAEPTANGTSTKDKKSPATDSSAAAPADNSHSLAVAASTSSYLTGPLTLAHALTTVPELQQLVSSCCTAKAPLRVAVLGADEAECAHWDAWQAVGVLVGCPLLVQLVGPEVPDHLHLSVKPLEEGVTLAFYMRAFEELVGAMERRWAALPAELQAEPQVLLGVNMGLSCPDYRWGSALAAAERIARRGVTLPAPPAAPAANGAAAASSSTSAAPPAAAPASPPDAPPAQPPASVPLLLVSTANTQPEAYEESLHLLERGWALVSDPARNPFSSLEVLQSGTMANDVYRKSSWLALHAVAAARPAKRKSWGEWATDVVQNIKQLVTPSKKKACPSPAPAAAPANGAAAAAAAAAPAAAQDAPAAAAAAAGAGAGDAMEQ